MAMTQPIEPGGMRVGDAERERMAARLERAHAAGQLQLDEFDERVQQAYRARVRSDLDALVKDLPSERSDSARSTWRPEATQPGSGPKTQTPWMNAPGLPQHWRSGPAQSQSGGVMRYVWISLAVLVGLWLLVGPVIGALFNVAFTVLIIAGVVTLVGKLRDRHR